MSEGAAGAGVKAEAGQGGRPGAEGPGGAGGVGGAGGADAERREEGGAVPPASPEGDPLLDAGVGAAVGAGTGAEGSPGRSGQSGAAATAAAAAPPGAGQPGTAQPPAAPVKPEQFEAGVPALSPPDPRLTLEAMKAGLPPDLTHTLELAYTRITDDARALLTSAIEATKRHKAFGHVFSDPVDYIGLELEDYLDVVKRPMDLSSLAVNLALGEYYYLYEFVRDADLIWANCRTYNGHSSNDFFYNAANEVEAFFVQQVENALRLGLTHRDYKVMVRSTSIPNRAFEAQPVPLANVQLLLRRLSELPDEEIAECVAWYVTRSGADPDAVFGDEIVMQFTNADTQLLREWECVIQARLQAYREAKKERSKKQKR